MSWFGLEFGRLLSRSALLVVLVVSGKAFGQDFSFVFDCSFNDSQKTDFVTYGCLLGFENHVEPTWCAESDPAYGARATEAYDNWRNRNSDLLTEIRSACAARLLRAYGHDQAAIATAKEDANQRDKKHKEEMKARYWTGSQPQLNCSSYIHGMKEGADEAAGLTKILKAIRDCRARPVQWPNK